MYRIIQEIDKPYTSYEGKIIDLSVRILFASFEIMESQGIPNRFYGVIFKHADEESGSAPAYHMCNWDNKSDSHERYFGDIHLLTIVVDNIINEMDRMANEYQKLINDIPEFDSVIRQCNSDINTHLSDVKHTVLLYLIVHEIMHSLVFTDNYMLNDDYITGDISSYDMYRRTVEMLTDLRAVEFIRNNTERLTLASDCYVIMNSILQNQLDSSRENIDSPFCLG